MPIPQGEKKIQNLSVKEMVYDQLKSWIIEGVLEPGEKISDKALATYFNVSKTPVREAIQMLESQKLAKTFPRKETIVAELKTDNIEEWYVPIIALEECAVKEACKKAEPDDIRRLNQLNEALYTETRKNDALDVMYKDRAFHDSIIKVAGNQYIYEFLDILQLHIQRLEYLYFKKGRTYNLGEHEQIIKAIEERDEIKAAALMRSHWSRAMDKLKEILEMK